MLRMVAAISAGIVFLDVELWMTDRADRPPIKLTHMDDQIRSHIAHIAIDFLRLEDQ